MRSQFPTNGSSKRFQINWPYLDRAHVFVTVDGTPWGFTWLSDNEIELAGALPSGKTVVIHRVTPLSEDFAKFREGREVTADDLNKTRRQLLYALQEIVSEGTSGGRWTEIAAALTASASDTATIVSARDQVLAVRDSLDASLAGIGSLQTRLTQNESLTTNTRQLLLDEINNRTTSDADLAARVSTLEVGTSQFGALVSQESVARADQDDILAARVDTVEGRLDTEVADLAAQVSEESSIRLLTDQGLNNRLAVAEANYALKTVARSDGKVAFAGIGLNAVASGTAAQSEIIFQADRFRFVPGNNVNGPLTSLMSLGTVNGATTLVLNSTTFGDQTIGARMIVDGSVEARHIKAESITADRIDTRGLTIKDASGNVIFGAGVPITVSASNVTGLGTLATKNGVTAGEVSGLGSLATKNAVAANEVSGLGTLATKNSVAANEVSGLGAFATLSVISGTNSSTYIEAGAIQNAQIGNILEHNSYQPGVSGWRLDKNGDVEINNLTARGNIRANSLTANTVVTENLVAEAVNQLTSILVSASGSTGNITSGPDNGSTGMAWTSRDVCSITFTTTNDAPISVEGYCDTVFSYNHPTGVTDRAWGELRILRNGVVIYTLSKLLPKTVNRETEFDTYAQVYDFFLQIPALTDAPGPGTHIYTLQVGMRRSRADRRGFFHPLQISWSLRGIRAIQIKR